MIVVVLATILIRTTSFGAQLLGRGQPTQLGIYYSNYTLTHSGNLSIMFLQATGYTLQNVGVACAVVGGANLNVSVNAPGRLGYVYFTNFSWVNDTRVFVQDLRCYGADGKTNVTGLAPGEQVEGFVYFNYTYGKGNASSNEFKFGMNVGNSLR